MASASSGVEAKVHEFIYWLLDNTVNHLQPFCERSVIGHAIFWTFGTVIMFTIYRLLSHFKHKAMTLDPLKVVSSFSQPRFRSRDKLRYYATKFRRRCNEVTEKLNQLNSQEERQQLITTFAKRLFNREDERHAPLLIHRRLPESFFEPEVEKDDTTLPEDLQLILSRVRVLKYLGEKITTQLGNLIQSIELENGQSLFHSGDRNENIFVVKSGKITLLVREQDGSDSVLHEVKRGGNVHSLIAVLDILSNNPSTFRNLQAVATEPSTVLRIKVREFLDVCRRNPPAILRLVQMIAVGIHRVTFTALHNYFGLSSELMRQDVVIRDDLATLRYLRNQAEECPSTHNSTQLPPEAISGPEDQIAIPLTESFEPVSREEIEDEDAAPFEEVEAPIGLDSASGAILHDAKTSELLQLGEAVSDVTVAADSQCRTSCHRDTTALGVTGTERRLVSRSSIRRRLADAKRSSSDDPEAADSFSVHKPPDTIALTEQSDCSGNNAEDPLLLLAQQDFATLFGLADASRLSGMIMLVTVQSGDILSKEQELQAEVYLVLSGELHIMQTAVGPGPERVRMLCACKPGELVGLLGLITGEPNIYSIQAASHTRLAVFPRECFFSLIRSHPEVMINASYICITRLSPLLRQADFALEWVAINAGQALYKQGDPSDCVYVILNGRFREVNLLPDGNRQVVSELGRGDFVGFLEVFSSKPRVRTVLAVRDSEVAQIPPLLLNWLRRRTPHVVSHLIQLLSERLLGSLQRAYCADRTTGAQLCPPVVSIAGSGPLSSAVDGRLTQGTMANLRAIAILPATGDINAEAFCLELQHVMSVLGSSVRFTSEIIRKRVGPHALDGMWEYRLGSWLNHQEDLHRMVFYVCDSHRSSAWTRRCLRQADCVLVLALASANPARPSAIEMMLLNDPTKVTKVLVLMYPMETDHPPAQQTAGWLNARPWVNQHYHIRCPPRVFSSRSSNRLVAFYTRVFAREVPNVHSDMSRLARYLTGQAVALVLGGGGARGCAHVGAIRAFQEAGIPIDMVGGTSIGSLIGALWAEETRTVQLTQRARDFSFKFKSIWAKLRDVTYPSVSIFSGREFNAHLEAIFKDRQIEDLWLPYFCVTTDISNCKMRVHTHGSVWRYVRSSMSLSGYLPPLCDPYDGSLLLDGGYVNNLPADVMASFGAKTIFAVDVGSAVETELTNYGDWLSGWWLIYQRFFRFGGPAIRVPNLTEIQSRLAYVSCVRQLEEVKSSGICHYMRPPIDKFMTLQFASYDEIVSVGYDYAKCTLSSWQSSGILSKITPGSIRGSSTAPTAMPSDNPISQQRHALVDLAEMVSRIEGPSERPFLNTDTEEDVGALSGNIHLTSRLPPQRSPSSAFSPSFWPPTELWMSQPSISDEPLDRPMPIARGSEIHAAASAVVVQGSAKRVKSMDSLSQADSGVQYTIAEFSSPASARSVSKLAGKLPATVPTASSVFAPVKVAQPSNFDEQGYEEDTEGSYLQDDSMEEDFQPMTASDPETLHHDLQLSDDMWHRAGHLTPGSIPRSHQGFFNYRRLDTTRTLPWGISTRTPEEQTDSTNAQTTADRSWRKGIRLHAGHRASLKSARFPTAHRLSTLPKKPKRKRRRSSLDRLHSRADSDSSDEVFAQL